MPAPSLRIVRNDAAPLPAILERQDPQPRHLPLPRVEPSPVVEWGRLAVYAVGFVLYVYASFRVAVWLGEVIWPGGV